MMAVVETFPAPGACADPPAPVPLARALSELMAGLGPVDPSRIALADAANCVLAAPLLAPGPVPALAVALRSGWAVRAAETVGATPYSPVLLTAEPVQVQAGSTLPRSADAVLAQDAVSIGAGGAEVFEPAAPGHWTRRAGEDARTGTVLRDAGRNLSSLDVAVALEAGLQQCEVRRPKVVLIGAPPGATPRDAILGRTLASLCRRLGADVTERCLGRSLTDFHLILAVADPAQPLAVARSAGARTIAPRLALRPGEDGCLARIGNTPMICLPGRLADLLALWLCVVAPCLGTLAGRQFAGRGSRQLTRKIASTVGLAEVALLRESGIGLEPIATGDLPLSAIADADAWHLVPPESEGYAAGTTIMAERLPGR